MKTTFKKSAKWTAMVLAALILSAAALFGLAQTDAGKRHLVRLIARAAAPAKGVRIDMGRLTGLVPFDFRLDALTFSDAEGPWLGIDGLTVRWSPIALLKGRLLVHELSAARLRLERMPSAQEKRAGPSRGMPKWPAWLRRLLVDRFAIDELALGKDFPGKDARFRVEAGILADLPAGERRASFRLERTDGPAAKALVEAALKGSDPVLTLDTRLEEARGGLIAETLGIQGPISLSLQGQGPLSRWKGRLLAEAGDLGRLDSEIETEAAAEPRVRAAGSVTLRPGLIPPKASAWVEGGTRFSVAARRLKTGILAIDQADLETRAAAVRIGQATLDLQKRTARGRFAVTCDDLKPLGTLTALNTAGRLKAEGTFAGPLIRPEADLRLNLRNVEVDRVRLSNSDARLTIGFLGPLNAAFPGLRLAGGGRVEGLSVREVALPPQKTITWEMAGAAMAGESLRVQGLKVASGKITLELSGTVYPSGPRGSLDAELALADLQPVSDFLGLQVPPAGPTRLKVYLQGDGQKRALFAEVQGATGVLDRTLPPLQAVVGRELRYRANVAFTDGTLLSLSDIRLEAATGSLGGKASFDLRRRILQSSWSIVLPQVDPFSPLINRPLKGSVRWEGRLEGPLSRLSLSGKGLGQDIRVEGLHVERASIDLQAEGLPSKSRGRLSMELRSKGHTIGGEADFVLDGRRVAMNILSLKGAETELTAKGSFDLQRKRTEGTIRGRSANLAALASFFSQPVEGSADIDAQFKISESAQEISFALDGQSLRSPFGQAQRLKVKGRLREPFTAPQGSTTVEIKDFRLKDLVVSSVTVRAEGRAERLSFDADAKGRYKEAFELQASGISSLSTRAQKIAFSRFRAQVAEVPFTLAEPSSITLSNGSFSLAPFRSRLGSGEVEGEASMGAGEVSLALDFKNLSLKALGAFGVPPLAGSAGGGIRLRGSPQNPEGHLELRLKDIGVEDLQAVDLPPGTVAVNADLTQRRLYAGVSLQGLTAKPFEASLDLPLRLSFSPLSFSLPEQEALLGTLRGEVQLARVAALLGVDDQKLEGGVDIRLSLGGTWKDFLLTGDAFLDKGAYENFRTGTVLRDLEVKVTSDKKQLRLERALATDGDKGRISAQGWMDLRPDLGFPFEAELTIKQAKPFRHDRAVATTGGRLTLSGNLSKTILTGQIVVESAEFSIPERLPQEITELNVIEIHGREEKPLPARQEKSRPGDRLSLDVSVSSRGRTFVSGRGLDSEWEGDLRVSGKASEPVLAGKFSVVRGRFDFLGKRFNLTRGSITFDGSVPPSPTLDVVAESRAKDITAYLHLSGPALSPKFELSSQPSLPSDEILSRILFGRSVTQITPVQAVVLANALNTLAGGGGGFDFMGRTRKWLGLDELDIKQSGDKMEESSLSAGKYLSDTIYLEVEQGLDPGSGKASVKWEITPNITVETEVGANAEGGAGINWKWDY